MKLDCDYSAVIFLIIPICIKIDDVEVIVLLRLKKKVVNL